MAEMMYWEALRRAQDEELANDPLVILMGEDIGLAGGTYKATQGLFEKYGPERVIDTPISENGYTGVGIGASFLGVRPIIEIMSVNFAWLATDQIVNTAAKVRYMSGGQLTAPVVIRTPGGTAHQLGAQHSARMEKVFMGIAGLRVVTPSNPRQAYGLLKSATRCDDPVFFNEHELMYNMRGEVPDEEFFMPLEGSEVAREGRDITLFGYNISVLWCLQAAEILSREHGIEAEVVDLYSLSPLDRDGIRQSVAKTHRALIAEEAEAPVGVGSEVMAILNEECFFELDTPPVRVSALNAPIPYNRQLEKATLPKPEDVVQAVLKLFERGSGTTARASAKAAEPAPRVAPEAKAQASASEKTAAAAPAQSMPGSETPEQAAPEGGRPVKMPQLSDTMTEGVVVSWEKQIGDKVERGDVIATVETDKAIMDVEVFREGYLSGPMAPVDATVPVGEPIAYLVPSTDDVVDEEAAPQNSGDRSAAQPEPEEKPAAAEPAAARPTAPVQSAPVAPAIRPEGHGSPAPRPEGRLASPYARKRAAELGVDLNDSRLGASGPQGAIVAADVEQLSQVASAAAPTAMPEGVITEPAVPGDGRPMSSMERAVSHAMSGSVTMPLFRVTLHVQPDALQRACERVGVSFTTALAKACALAIEEHPSVNWCYQPKDRLVEREHVDVGIAVALEDGGLVVPVLRGCHDRDLPELADDLRGLVKRARQRRLSPEEYTNPTFMISNMGMLGVSFFDAIPTPGTSSILAVASVGEQGLPLTLTCDHRVLNGATAVQYLNTLQRLIEFPEDWMGVPGHRIPEGDWDYDVVVIGGGPGGEDCARDLAEHGIKVAMVNDAPLPGGECLWRGCIPSKAWRAAADRLRDRAHDGHLGVTGTDKPKLDFKALEKTRRDVLETRGEMALKTDQGVRVNVLQGFGAFEDEHTLLVHTGGNSDDPHARPVHREGGETQRITFGCAVIATGAPPFVPPIPGAREGLETGGVLTSDTVWGLEATPKRLAVIGGGAIGVEMAQIFQDFGSEVLLLEAQDRILAEVEPEVAQNLAQILDEDPRLTVRTSAQVDKVDGKPGDMKLSYKDAEGKSRSFKADYVIMATGKRPVLEPLALDRAGVKTEQGVIAADKHCRTSVRHIYAVGDVIGGLMLAHTASAQARVAAGNIAGEPRTYDQALDCGVIFTRPQAAFVGLSSEQAKAAGLDPVEVKAPMAIDAKAMIANETQGFIKLVADRASHRIIGVHFLADHADTLIGEAVMMVAGRMTLEQVGAAIHPHPTQTELFGDLARRLASRLRRSERKQSAPKAKAAS